MDATPDRALLTDRDFHFAVAQYTLLSNRVTELQKEREVWIRHSIIATFGFFGWLAVYRDSISATFMLEAVELQTVYFIAFVFNAGGALRFFFIQRDINRLVTYLANMERGPLALADVICDGPTGRGIRDRHWHAPSICYWAAVSVLSLAVALFLTL